MREAPCYFRKPVELLLVRVVIEDDRSVVVVPVQEAHLRGVSQRPPNVIDHAPVRFIEFCKSTLTLRPAMDGRLYKLVTWQQLLESEMCFQHCIPAWSPSDQLDGLACGQTMKVSFLAKVLVVFLVGYKENLVDYTACSLVRMFAVNHSPAAQSQQFPSNKSCQPPLDRPRKHPATRPTRSVE
ncbi:hypothetical protein MRX96_044900 [Rhipicephalus microplus]